MQDSKQNKERLRRGKGTKREKKTEQAGQVPAVSRLRPGHEEQAREQALAGLSHLQALAQAVLSTWSTFSPSQTLTEPSKHNSGDVSSRKPS